MSDELQVQTPTGLQVQGSPTFQQTGSGNTQIGYIGQQINYITMGGMTLINLPACMILGKIAIDALRDYEKQKSEGKNPEFHASDIGLGKEGLDYWD